MKEMTTTKSLFGEVQDITHKPKRMQGQNFAGTPLHMTHDTPTATQQKQEIPDFITLERAIAYYEGNANSTTSEGKLSMATANFLRELLEFRASKLKSSLDKGADLIASLKQRREKTEGGDSSDNTDKHTDAEVHSEQ